MKTFLSSFILFSLFLLTSFSQRQPAKDPVGSWRFEAPAAREGYTSGKFDIIVAEKKHSATISFTGSDYKIPANMVKVTGDSLYLSLYIEDQDIRIRLKMESNNKMTGKATYSEGEIILTMLRL